MKYDENITTISKNLISKAKHYYPNDYKKIERAFELAKVAHEGQSRASGSPYIVHPAIVADILMDMGLDCATVCAGLLHDTVEDTSVTDEKLREEFGDEVANLVQGVTKLSNLKFSSVEEEQAENIRKMFFAMAKDIRVIIIKLADRLHNMRSLQYLSHERQLKIAKETLDVFAPIAGRLGISQIKCELEDLCLKYLDPESYEFLVENIAEKREERQEFIDKMVFELKGVLKELEVEGEVFGRTKHFYSIYRKMKTQGKTLNEIFDLTALRVIVKTVKDCYGVLGAIHAKWKPIPGRFKDYIAVPKPNLYQSLHTTVMTSMGVPFEIQIRTEDMNKIAEYGIAAHWKYKEGIKGSSQFDGKLSWIQEVLAYETDLKDSKEFLDLIKHDISIGNEVYCFTPKGDGRNLTAGATALDFAYAIHSGVGNKCVGVKINGKIAPISTVLQNGDVVEVLINQNSKGPSQDWLKIVKTSGAKAKIRQFFKREQKEENIRLGKSMLEREAKRRGIALSQLLTNDAIDELCMRYQYDGIDEVFAAVGYGALSVNQVMSKLISRASDLTKMMVEAQNANKLSRVREKSNVEIKGYDDLAVRFSRCCSPVPGDEIVGYISRGRGVCIHRKDCHSLKNLEIERLVEANWINPNPTSNSFPATLQIILEDKVGVFAEITRVIANDGLPMIAINARKDKKHNAVAVVTVEISNHNQLNLLINHIESLPNTIKVFRTTI